MRVTLAVSLVAILPAALSAHPASAQAARGSVYLSPMGEPFIASTGQSSVAMWLTTADNDRNGSISLAELSADADRFFKRLDVDVDGRIGGFEMTRYEEEIAPASLRAAAGARPAGSTARRGRMTPDDPSGQTGQRQGPAERPEGNSGQRTTGEFDGGIASIPQPVAMTDVDMSGSVTPEEFTRAAARRFAVLDVNKNGLLEASELSTSRR